LIDNSFWGGVVNRCEKIDVCGFFTNNMTRLPTLHERLKFKSEYCTRDKTKCARFIVNNKIHCGCTPSDDQIIEEVDRKMKSLFPNDLGLANEIIEILCNK